jgi:hypothetical protein
MSVQQSMALVFAFGMLVVAADFQSTASLAQAIAILIMVSVLFYYGPDALNNMLTLVGQDPVMGSTAAGQRGTTNTQGK